MLNTPGLLTVIRIPSQFEPQMEYNGIRIKRTYSGNKAVSSFKRFRASRAVSDDVPVQNGLAPWPQAGCRTTNWQSRSPGARRGKGPSQAGGQHLGHGDSRAYPAALWRFRVGYTICIPEIVPIWNTEYVPISPLFGILCICIYINM